MRHNLRMNARHLEETQALRPQVDSSAKNVLGGRLRGCSKEPLTGFYRTGCCETGSDDRGVHTVCVVVDAAFLAFSAERGNDLSTPAPQWGFAGLRPGDRWCLCAARWQEALDAGVAPAVVLTATHEATLGVVARTDLIAHAVDEPLVGDSSSGDARQESGADAS